MFIYTHSTKYTIGPDPRVPSDKRRTDFAREAVRLEFRPRDARAINHGGFEDRRPDELPRPSPASWRPEPNGTRRVELTDLIGREAA